MIEAPQDFTERPAGRRPRSQMPGKTRAALDALSRDENAAAARKLVACTRTARTRAGALRSAGHHADLVHAMAASEVARVLTCSQQVAETYIGIGAMLLDRTPKIREAFLAGDLDHRRVAAIERALRHTIGPVVDQIEDEVLAAAREMTPGPLEREVERLTLLADPASAEAGRRIAQTQRRTAVFPRAYGMAVFHAFLAADEAQRVQGALSDIAATVCPEDPRDKDQLRADALVVLAEGGDRLTCRCPHPECRRKSSPAAPRHRPPHVFVHVDLATLIRLAEDPAVLAGYGPIAPEYARLLAMNATWQLFITEGRTLAEHWHAANDAHRTPSAARPRQDGRTAEQPPSRHPLPAQRLPAALSAAPATAPADAPEEEDEPTDAGVAYPHLKIGPPLDPDYEEFLNAAYEKQCRARQAERDEARRICQTSPALRPGTAFGRARPAPPMLQVDHPPRISGQRPACSDAVLRARIIDRLVHDPALRSGLTSDGHGGFDRPPAGALTYRPGSALRTAVRLRDGHCRHPGCAVIAARCDIDHVVPFDHRDPRRGGWTIESNLQCLCRLHHRLKTAGYSRVHMLAGGAQWWCHDDGGQAVTLPAGRRLGFTPLAPTPASDDSPPPY